MEALTAPTSSARPARRCRSNTAAHGPTPPVPTARQNASSRLRSGNGPTPNTGPAQSKETLDSSHGQTSTTTKDHMVASTTNRPSAESPMQQPLDLLQAPGQRGV